MAEREGPAHVAIITDGNGRWAKARGLPVAAGTEPAPRTCGRGCATRSSSGIRELTVYAFSTENWSRSPAEVKDLIDLIAEYIDRVTPGTSRRERAPALHRRARQIRFRRAWRRGWNGPRS